MLFPLCLAWATIYNVISVIFHFSLFLYIYINIYTEPDEVINFFYTFGKKTPQRLESSVQHGD